MSTITGVGVFADSRRLLRLALRLDAVVSGVNGLAYVALAKPLESLLGADAGVNVALGVFLLVYAAVVWAVSMPASPNRWAVTAVIEANLMWTALSIAAVVAGWFSLKGAGEGWAVLQAVTVAGLAGLQFYALRRTR